MTRINFTYHDFNLIVLRLHTYETLKDTEKAQGYFRQSVLNLKLGEISIHIYESSCS